jgi:hypothetical protein
MENLGTAAQSLQTVLPKVVHFLHGKKLAEL